MGRGHLIHLDTALLVRIAFDSDLLPLGWVVGGMGRLSLGPRLQNPDPKAGFAAPFVSVSVALTRGGTSGAPHRFAGQVNESSSERDFRVSELLAGQDDHLEPGAGIRVCQSCLPDVVVWELLRSPEDRPIGQTKNQTAFQTFPPTSGSPREHVSMSGRTSFAL